VERLVARATGMPRPAKLARQTRSARRVDAAFTLRRLSALAPAGLRVVAGGRGVADAAPPSR
jgi:hypothetical protein